MVFLGQLTAAATAAIAGQPYSGRFRGKPPFIMLLDRIVRGTVRFGIPSPIQNY